MDTKTENSILVSIRLMTYNHSEFIIKALEGIDKQITNFNFEVVIGDDFSTDDNLKKINDFEFKNENITVNLLKREKGDAYWIKRNELGRLYNFTNIIENCQGKYIALLDGDDYWTDPLKLQKQVDFLEANSNFSGAFHNTILINEMDTNVEAKIWRTYNKNIFTLEDTISKSALLHTSSFMFRSSDLYLPNWFVKIQSADMALFSLIASKGDLFRIDEPMSVYRKNEIGITTRINLKEYHKNRIELFNFLKETIGVIIYKKADEVIRFHKNELLYINPSKFRSIKHKIITKLKNVYKRLNG